MQQRQSSSNNYSRVISQLQQWDDENWSIAELELLKTLATKKIQDLTTAVAAPNFFSPLFESKSFLSAASVKQAVPTVPLAPSAALATTTPVVAETARLGVWGAKNLKEIIAAPPTPSLSSTVETDEDYFLNPPMMKACGDEKCPCVYYIQGEDDEVVTGKVRINPKEIFIAGISIETAESPDERLAAHNELRALLKNTPCRIYQPTGKQYAFFSFKSHREAVRAQILFSRATFRNNPLYVSFAHFEQHHERPSDNPTTTKTYLTSKSK